MLQLAVGLYHYRRGNEKGAAKLLAASQLSLVEAAVEKLGLDISELRICIAKLQQAVEKQAPFADIQLPICDQVLLELCMQHCAARQLEWGVASPTHPELLHKHMLRDRSEVVAERERQKKARAERSAR